MKPLIIERGTRADYTHLAPVHYRQTDPAVIERIYRAARSDEPQQSIGVLVVSYPALACAARTVALGDRYVGCSRSERAEHVNREMRTISRVIVDPRFRGLGLGRAMIRAALIESTTRFTEAITSMGRLHPIFERAGMKRITAPLTRDDRRLAHRLQALGIDRRALSDVDACLDAIREAADPGRLLQLRRLLASWKRAAPRSFRAQPTDWSAALRDDGVLTDVLHDAAARLLYPPYYYVHDRDAPLNASTLGVATDPEVIHVDLH